MLSGTRSGQSGKCLRSITASPRAPRERFTDFSLAWSLLIAKVAFRYLRQGAFDVRENAKGREEERLEVDVGCWEYNKDRTLVGRGRG